MRFFSFRKFMVLFAIMGVASFSVAAASSAPEEGPAGEISYGQNAAAGHYADINGIKFYYETYGDGAPLILIHGNGGSIASLAAQIAFFSRTYKVIVADSRGHGKSGLGDQPLTYSQMMEDWNVLLDFLNIQQASIFGWSDGGILGLLLAIDHPDKVAKMAIMGANLRPDDTAVHGWVKPILAQAEQDVEAQIAGKDTSRNWALQKQLLALLKTQPDIKVESLHKIMAPVLVMAGDRDVIRGEHTLEIFNNIEKSQLAILPGNTHFAPVTDAKKFNAILNDFFETPFSMPTTQAIMEQH
ncbi:alpha/beta fold hydrolase [Paremcibacter congregatus]|uniref:Alpha/beta hydrolase n=1 Tax=Paremcibacter congregatus TaxID=2043170 RepID=A0A2G4YTE2_9PROT|nr:alpha/beta hydrolase [Paremcibacter congregatus]PHZ85612.1 alpha/beta hydrolase [Paremcibacter congregatus]QDE26572.1 alpha/beta hydrolase [Paremcibacter congregatus]